jgi:hypothetical protein
LLSDVHAGYFHGFAFLQDEIISPFYSKKALLS